MSRNSEFFKKDCPQCGAPMEKMSFTPKKGTGKVVSNKNTMGFREVRSGVKSGPKQVWWQCPEDFSHKVKE